LPLKKKRQGDHISPYLFIIYANIFSNLISQAHVRHHIRGVKIATRAPEISHLFFC
jgi:hypothetical protein